LRKKRISKNRNYKIGVNVEYNTMYLLKNKHGYRVRRAYASRGATDWWALRAVKVTPDLVGQTLTLAVLAQCKKHDGLLKAEEAANMWDEAEVTGGNSYHVYMKNRRTVYEPVYLSNNVPIFRTQEE
jgi:hypothetical protein